MEIRVFNKFRLNHLIHSKDDYQIWHGESIVLQEPVVLKMELVNTHNQKIINEIKTLRKIQFKRGVPDLLQVGQQKDFNIIVQQRLSYNLHQLLLSQGGTLDLKTVLQVADQVLRIIEYMHHRGYIHRNITLTNISVGHGIHTKHIFINDYKDCKRYMFKNKHITSTHTSLYQKRDLLLCNKNQIRGHETSRRDDLESIALLLILLLKGTLPWSHLLTTPQSNNLSSDQEELHDEILQQMDIQVLKQFCKDVPKEFIIFLEYCRSLSFDDTPDYFYIKNTFQQLFLRRHFIDDELFCWNYNEKDDLNEYELQKLMKECAQLEKCLQLPKVQLIRLDLQQQFMHQTVHTEEHSQDSHKDKAQKINKKQKSLKRSQSERQNKKKGCIIY